MKVIVRKLLALTTLSRVTSEVAKMIRAADAAWHVESGHGNRFSDTVHENDQYQRACWLTATKRTRHDDAHDLVVRITLNVLSPDSYHRASELFMKTRIEGETEFKIVDAGRDNESGCWRGWVRIGIDCASVWLGENRPDCHCYAAPIALLTGEQARVQAALQAAATARPVPGYPFTRQPEWFTKAAADLQAGRAAVLLPAGFGTGYRFTTRQQSRFDPPAPAALCEALGVPRLYAQTLDCD